MMSSSHRLVAADPPATDPRRDSAAHRVAGTVRACSEAGGMVAVSWPASPGEHVEASVLASMIGDLPVLVVSVNVREPNGTPPIVHVAVDGEVLEVLEMRRVASVAELGGIFRAEVPLPADLIDGATHRLEIVASAYTPADETQPEIPAFTLEAPVGYGSHEVLFYAKRFSNRQR